MSFINLSSFSAHYKVELFDVRTGGFTPPTPGIGMNVEVKDPDMKIILSRVCILIIVYIYNVFRIFYYFV